MGVFGCAGGYGGCFAEALLVGSAGVLSGLSGLSGFWWGLRLLVFLEVRGKWW